MRPAGRFKGLPFRLGASLALLVFGAVAMASGLDRMSLFAPTLGRLVPNALQAQAARSTAALAITQEQPRLAIAAARRAVAADPVEPASTSLLATAYLFNGQHAEAEAAFRVAARFGWREAATQVYWYEAALLAGDLPRAVDRADALLRTHPTLPARDQVLAPLESTAAGRAALIVRMAGRPNWLHKYLNPEPEVSDETLDRRSQVLADLATAGTRLGCEAVTPFVSMSLTRGARGNAERVWTGHCPDTSLTEGLADGGFEQFGRDETSPFGWRSVPSGDVSVRSVEKQRGMRAIKLVNRAAVSRLVLRQAVALEPGTYRLTGAATPGRIAASLGCGALPPLPSLTDGDLAAGGQVLRVERCSRLELGLWVRPGADEAELDSVRLEKIG
jgi:tetratricopeptide (TPR) repeat protein